MRLFAAIASTLLTLIVVLLLNTAFPGVPALGKLLDPVNGWAANAEDVDKDFNIALKLKGVHAPVIIWMEDRMVPHIRAGNDHDVYFAQGYIHAYFRLWQMEFQTRAAAGRIGEVVGEKWIEDAATGKKKNAILEFDRGQRRKGMVYGAEQSLRAMEGDPHTKEMLDAYTAGINAYIDHLAPRDLPLEYKLMGYKPEAWTNLKCSLLLKYMADELTGYTEDFPLTALRDYLPRAEFESLYPQRLPGSIPVIPSGTKFPSPSLTAIQPLNDSIWVHINPKSVTLHHLDTLTPQQTGEGIGSNNWAISGKRTASGAPILCNDPHLGLNLPSLWFEIQLTAPGLNVYGASLPGAPGVVIGFNDSLSWGVTNNYRDVKDFYEIEAMDASHYRLDGAAKAFVKRVEHIGIKGKPDFTETVDYTIHGPVIYDEHFADPLLTGKKFAIKWMAHRPTNELLSIYQLNRAKDYDGFVAAIQHFECPAQNFVYADRSGNIAMWGQGQFINKWKNQGRYLMKGNTTATLWGQNIPMAENPHALNPEQGYLASANQITTDSTYPYWYNGYFSDFRAMTINQLLQRNSFFSVHKMMQIQNNTWSLLAQHVLPRLLACLKAENNSCLSLLTGWDYDMRLDSRAATVFQIWWDVICNAWNTNPDFAAVTVKPEYVLYRLETGDDSSNALLIRDAFRKAMDSLEVLSGKGQLAWYQAKATTLPHLAKLPAFSYANLKIGGSATTINAVKKSHGPSWRMIVELGKDSINAYGVYPGGQSGNPGSRHYGDFIPNWTDGKYYPLRFPGAGAAVKPAYFPYTITIHPN